MNKNEVKTNVKDFYNKYKTPIIAGAALATGYIAGFTNAKFLVDLGLTAICASNPGLEETLIKAIDNHRATRS